MPTTAATSKTSAVNYERYLADEFWSPDFRQTSFSTFSFTVWEQHYQARKNAMREYLYRALSEGLTILESFSHDHPTADFTSSNVTGCADTLWNIKGTRRLDIHGTVSDYAQPFIASCMTPTYLSDHLANRIFGFGMRVATWLERRQTGDPA